jgi:succinate dehydrogenase/fumarate reductase flavoprotein subunit
MYIAEHEKMKGLPLGRVKGFNVTLMHDGKVAVQGPSGRVQWAGSPTLASIEAAIRRIPKRHAEAEEAILRHKSELERMEQEINKPFRNEGKLEEARRRLAELQAELESEHDTPDE